MHFQDRNLRIPRRKLLNLLPALAGSVALWPLAWSRAEERPGRERPGREGSLHFLATADSGSGDRHQFANGSAMAALHRRDPVDLVIMGGDNIYDNGDMREVVAKFERPYSEMLKAGVPFHAVLGNHDIRSNNGAGQLVYPGFGMKGRWYSLRRGPVEFFMHDSNVDWPQQMKWLRSALAASRAPWKVLVGHHPIYSSGLYGDDREAIGRLTPLLRRHGVQLYINGHDHNYERSVPINGTTYLTVGNGGAALRPVVPGPNSARAVSTYGFASLHADPDTLTIEAWSSSSQRLDRARLNRSGVLI